jgi:hypothetical protein
MLVVPPKKLLLTVMSFAVALLILWVWNPWASLRFHGDGNLSDAGFFSYPRYQISFSEIPLNKISEHHFRFWGLPNDQMQLVLYAKDKRPDKWANRPPPDFTELTIEALLTDDKGHVACHVSGHPTASDGEDNIWGLMSNTRTPNSSSNCNLAQVSTNRAYDLTIRVAGVGPDFEALVVTPKLRGGGLELP